MFDVSYGNVTHKQTRYDKQSVVEFIITGKESGEAFEGTFTAGSAHDMGNVERVNEMILQAVAYDALILDEAEEKSLRGLVEHLIKEYGQEEVSGAFDAAEQLLKQEAWRTKLTANELAHLQSLLED